MFSSNTKTQNSYLTSQRHKKNDTSTQREHIFFTHSLTLSVHSKAMRKLQKYTFFDIKRSIEYDAYNVRKRWRSWGWESNFPHLVMPPSTTAPATVPLQIRSQRPIVRSVTTLGTGGTATLECEAASETALCCVRFCRSRHHLRHC